MPKDSRSKTQDPKDPDNSWDYGVNTTDILTAIGNSVTLSSATIVGTPGLTVVSGPVVSGAYATARFSGGTDGTDYPVTFRCVFSDGQTRDLTITIPVRAG